MGQHFPQLPDKEFRELTVCAFMTSKENFATHLIRTQWGRVERAQDMESEHLRQGLPIREYGLCLTVLAFKSE